MVPVPKNRLPAKIYSQALDPIVHNARFSSFSALSKEEEPKWDRCSTNDILLGVQRCVMRN